MNLRVFLFIQDGGFRMVTILWNFEHLLVNTHSAPALPLQKIPVRKAPDWD